MTHLERPGVPRGRVRILIVDDEPANTEFLRHVLEPEGYGELLEFTDAAAALASIDHAEPDLILLDLMMPELDGYQFLERLGRRQGAGSYLPVMVVTADTSAEAQRRALSLGARDFLTKPLSPADVRLRVRNLLETRMLQARLREYNVLLEDRVVERTTELESARLEILDRLARAAEYRDDDTGQHTQRVGRVAARLAAVLGQPPETVELIRRAAPLHDVGKIGIPDAILLKEGRLTPQERAVMEDHTRIGTDILSGSRFPLLQLAEEIAYVHHERWDGAGYPEGLAGEAIPLSGRIVAVADVFDSLTHERPYKDAWTVKEALTEIQACSGSQFDPAVVEAMLRIAPEARVLTEASSPFDAVHCSTNGGSTGGSHGGKDRGNNGSRPGPDRDPDGAEAAASSGCVGGAAESALEADPLAARLREVEAENEALKREVRSLKGKLARRERRLEELSERVVS